DACGSPAGSPSGRLTGPTQFGGQFGGLWKARVGGTHPDDPIRYAAWWHHTETPTPAHRQQQNHKLPHKFYPASQLRQIWPDDVSPSHTKEPYQSLQMPRYETIEVSQPAPSSARQHAVWPQQNTTQHGTQAGHTHLPALATTPGAWFRSCVVVHR